MKFENLEIILDNIKKLRNLEIINLDFSYNNFNQEYTPLFLDCLNNLKKLKKINLDL